MHGGPSVCWLACHPCMSHLLRYGPEKLPRLAAERLTGSMRQMRCQLLRDDEIKMQFQVGHTLETGKRQAYSNAHT